MARDDPLAPAARLRRIRALGLAVKGRSENVTAALSNHAAYVKT